MEPLLNYRELAAASRLHVKRLKYLKNAGIIPYLDLGHKTIRFQASKVERALNKFFGVKGA
jgi:hypothetical protein